MAVRATTPMPFSAVWQSQEWREQSHQNHITAWNSSKTHADPFKLHKIQSLSDLIHTHWAAACRAEDPFLSAKSKNAKPNDKRV
jgi:hypothetical protein